MVLAESMKAVVLRRFGGPEVLELDEVERPKPDAGEVLVRVHAVSVNRTLDLKVRQDNYPVRARLPHVLGVDPSGVVAEVGSGVKNFAPGDRVAVLSFITCGHCRFCVTGEEANCLNSQHIGLHRWGGYAEYVVVPAENAYAIPEHLSFPEASVITRHFPMAFQLAQKGQLKPTAWLLVMGATGALGSSGVQVGKFIGAKVIAGAGADERVAAALSYGADFGVNYRKQDLAKEVMRITEGQGVDVVFENIADPTLWPGAFNSLAIGGRLVTAGAHGGGEIELDLKRLYICRLQIVGAAGTNRRDVLRALEAASQGKLRAIIDRVMPLEEAAAAHRIVEENQAHGKVILDPTLP